MTNQKSIFRGSKRKGVRMYVDVDFKEIMVRKSLEKGVSLADITRIEALQFKQSNNNDWDLKIKGKNKKGKRFNFEL